MSHVSGWLGDKIGRRVNQAWLCRRMDDSGLRWLRLSKRFFRDGDQFIKLAASGERRSAFVARVSAVAVVDGNKGIAFYDVDTGNVIDFSGRKVSFYDPKTLEAQLLSNDIKAANAGGGIVSDISTLAIGGVIGFLVGGIVAFLFHSTIIGLLGAV